VRECVLGVWLSLSACVGCSCHTTTEKVKIFRVCVFVCSFLVHISAVVKAKILPKTILSSKVTSRIVLVSFFFCALWFRDWLFLCRFTLQKTLVPIISTSQGLK
jgi:uncharacterized protein YcfL